MKSFGLFLCVLISFIFISCNQNEDFTPEEIFGGDFVGSVSFSDGQNEIQNDGASVQVVEDGDFWSFHFSDDIPSIDSILFDTGQNGQVMMNQGATSDRLIRITGRTLQIVYTVENQSWNANCSRPN